MERLNVFLVHGFLGRPQDWQATQNYLAKKNAELSCYAVDYFNHDKLGPQNNFAAWAKNFNTWVTEITQGSPAYLVGYSLGGRLALHALKENPKLWQQVFLLSTNPGLQDDSARGIRARQDQAWAEKFKSDPWDEVLEHWNAQAVFDGPTLETPRQEEDYDRERLCQALKNWSLSRQDDLRPVIAKHRAKIHWMVGERDKKFLTLAQDLKKDIPDLKVQVVAGGHRILLESPQEIAQAVMQPS